MRTLAKILLVEDEESIAKPLCKILGIRGYEVIWVTDGKEALELLSKDADFACLLVDIMMPVLDGWGFREQQLQTDRIRNIPTIFLSADNASERKAAEKSENFVPKPIDLAKLVSEIERLTHEKK